MKSWQKHLISTKIILMISSVLFIPVSEDVETSDPYTSLKSELNNIMLDSRWKNASASVTIRKASNGEMIYEQFANKGITPASSLKLLTGAAALDTLGENYRFTTSLLTDGKQNNGILNGNLYLRGEGDPTLLKANLDHFADHLVQLGIRQISGNLVGDDTRFDGVRLSAGILEEDEPYYYAAPVSALTLSPNADFDAGSVIVDATPTINGLPTKVTLTPVTNVLQVVNKSKTVPKGYKNTLKITRDVGTDNVFITGNAPIGASGKEFISVTNPTLYALDVLKISLREKGITFFPTSKVILSKTPERAHLLMTQSSMPLKELVVPFMKLSNNTIAETLAKEMGKVVYGEGSWNAGLQVMREYVDSIGLDSTQWNFEDASGMSYSNKITSSQLSQLLYAVCSEPWYAIYKESLPVSGTSDRFIGGTLRNRLKVAPAKGNIMAKTGSLQHVKSLAGYARTKDGETLIFAILTENAKISTIPVIDQLATAITTTTTAEIIKKCDKSVTCYE